MTNATSDQNRKYSFVTLEKPAAAQQQNPFTRMPEYILTPQFPSIAPSRPEGSEQELLTISPPRKERSAAIAPTPAYPVHGMHHARDIAVFLKDNKSLRRVMISDLVYLEADGNYVEVYLRNGRVVLRNSMAEVLKCLPENIFFLVNRSQAVNVLLLDGIGTDEVNMGQRSFTLTKRYREDLLRHLNIIAGR